MGRTTRRKKNRRKVLRGGGPNENLFKAAKSGDLNALKAALDAGADVNVKDANGETSLMIASSYGNLVTVRELLARGANIEAADNRGFTSFIIAIEWEHPDIARELLDRGANIDAVTTEGFTSLLLASKGGNLDLVKDLLDSGANIEAADNGGFTSFMIAIKWDNLNIAWELLARGANIEAADKFERTSLMFATSGGNLDLVKDLLARGANTEAADDRGWTSLLYASSIGEDGIVQELLDRGANIEAAEGRGYTSLLIASQNEYPAVVELLVHRGADRNRKNRDGKTAYDLAQTREILDLLGPPPPPEVDEVWGGFTQDEFIMFEQIFGDTKAASDFSICPICHSQVNRAGGCMFMYHTCTSLKPPGLDKDLYNKYLTEGYEKIFWCTVCGRICDNHLHKALGSIDGPVLGNSPLPATDEEFFGNDCRAVGGGGLVEKLARFNAILKTAHEMQVDAGKITVREAKKRLVTAAWNAPLTMDKAALEAQLASKTFPTPISAFPVASAPVAAAAEAPAPNIPYPDIANPDLLPIVLPTGDDVTLLDEVQNAVQFRHKKADGVVNIHDGELIGLENLMINVLQNDRNKNFASAEFGECWNSGGGCTAKLYPDEIQDAINKSALTPEVKAQYETILADYRSKFNRKFKVGGRKKGGSLQLRGTQMFPLATDAVADCPLPKKGGKRRTRRKTRKQKRKTGKRKTRK